MRKKSYQKPATKVVQVKQLHMLSASPQSIQSTRSGYGAANDETWE